MQIPSKIKLFLSITGMLIVAVFLSNSAVYAQPVALEGSQQTSENSQEAFCSRLESSKNDLYNKVNQKVVLLQQQQGKEKNNIKNIFTNKEKELKTLRATWDSNRLNQISELKNKYRNDKQKKAAIEKFNSQVDKAINERRKKTDELTKLYYQESQDSISTNGIKLEEAAKSYQSNLVDAQNDANKSCRSGQTSQSVESQFKSNLQLGRSDLLNTDGGVSDYYNSIKSNAVKRKSELLQIKANFIVAVESASNQLKQDLQN